MTKHRKISLYRFELVELLNLVIGELDEENNKKKFLNETPSDHADRINGFLSVLGFGIDVKREIQQGDKKAISNILHWVLQRPQDLKRIAYTSKFLVELQIPDEFQMDEEIRETLAVYKTLQAEFTAAHQNVEMLRTESMTPFQLKKEIT